MTLEQFRKSWANYKVVLAVPAEGDPPDFLLRESLALCAGPYAGGLLFDTGGDHGAAGCVLSVDAEDNLLGPSSEGWVIIGKLVLIDAEALGVPPPMEQVLPAQVILPQ